MVDRSCIIASKIRSRLRSIPEKFIVLIDAISTFDFHRRTARPTVCTRIDAATRHGRAGMVMTTQTAIDGNEWFSWAGTDYLI
ncbi:MAG: hypothetical protein RLN95_00305, partial [Nitratireductor sp.]